MILISKILLDLSSKNYCTQNFGTYHFFDLCWISEIDKIAFEIFTTWLNYTIRKQLTWLIADSMRIDISAH